MFGRQSFREFLRDQREESRREHEETMSYLRRCDEEWKRRDERWEQETKRRDEEWLQETKRRDEEWEKAMERRDEKMGEFNREILLRNEKVYTAMIAQLEENTARVAESSEETRAQTRALLKLIDRFDDPGSSAAAA